MDNHCFEHTPSPPELCQRLCISSATSTPIPDTNYYDTTNNNYPTLFSLDSHTTSVTTGVHPVISSDENYWPSTYSSSSGASPNSTGYYSPVVGSVKRSPKSPSSIYNPLHHHHHHHSSNHMEQHGYYVQAQQYEKLGNPYEENYFTSSPSAMMNTETGVPVVRVVKRRNTANKKERRRTLSINSAFSYLRDRIPNVPADTKLSKIKTLRLATSYITYLTRVLEGEDTPGGFRAELVPSSRKINAERRANMKNNGITDDLQMLINNATHGHGTVMGSTSKGSVVDSRKKGRTGWPQEVWRNALKSEPQ